MNNIAIFVDSTSDMPTELRKKYNVEYVKMNIVVKDKEYPASLDWDIYSPKQLYDWMRNGICVKTTQVSVEEFMNKFDASLSQGNDIIYISCSSALSGSVNTAYSVSKELMEKYPQRKIICIDSLNSCFGQTLMAIKASKLREEGKAIDEIEETIEKEKLTVNQFATVATLDYLKNAGRVKASTAFFGNLFGVKPIIISDAKGQNYAIKKVKGRRNSLIELVNMAKEAIIDSENQIIFVGHADCIEDAELVKEHILKEIPCKGVYIDYIGPIIGASTGPGTVSIYAYGKEVTVVGE